MCLLDCLLTNATMCLLLSLSLSNVRELSICVRLFYYCTLSLVKENCEYVWNLVNLLVFINNKL